MQTTNDIRASFIDFFAAADHKPIASAPLVPFSDPTLMFVNAGMVPFKNVFTGLESPPAPRATSVQKCVRAGGKHNDLDNVGYTSRHHTFFEMLGNFSFGDYLKEEAIVSAWTLLTREWQLDPSRLLVTVYHTDDEAFGLWKRIAGLSDDRIIRIATADNFWSMGDTGPCGPSSEIFYDHGDHVAGGPPGSPDEDGDRFVEIWNLVFMQFDQQADGERISLPRPSIDTGMGLERVAAVMQEVHDNYETDTFRALIAASEQFTDQPARGDARASHRVIADHLRSTGFLLADGVLPSNEGRGYVLRRIMRRAMRHAHLLGTSEPLMHRLVPTLVAEMAVAYPELQTGQALIEEVLEREETQFRRTLDKGLRLLEESTRDMAGGTLDGETAFRLYDTYGFPYDLTEDALRPRGISVDRAGFEVAMKAQRDAARAAWKGSGETADDTVWFDIAEREGATEFIGYATTEGEGTVAAIVADGAEVSKAEAGDTIMLVTNQTPFYGESGGQAGDAGMARSGNGFEMTIETTSKPLGRLHAHLGRIVRGSIRPGDAITLSVDSERRDRVRANHSATHLLHAALRERLGEHVTQKGSLVSEDRFRFDFAHPKPMTAQEIARVEADVNAEIRHNESVGTSLMSPEDAVAAGALALFGEKYGDEVRVLSMGRAASGGRRYSVELCGGTHVDATGDIGLFVIVSESAVSSGVRRIEAMTGEAARQWLKARDATVRLIADALKTSPDEAGERVQALVEERRQMERELAEARRQLALSGGARTRTENETIGSVSFSGRVVEGLNPKELRPLLDETKSALGTGVAAICAVNDGKGALAVAVTDDLVGTFDAVALVRDGVAALGGKGGGGRADMAQGGGPDGSAAEAAIDAVRQAVAKTNA